MITLAIEASTYAGSLAVFRDATVLAEQSTAMKGATEERLMPAVSDALSLSGLRVEDVERVICGAGPGSFTSLRIAGAIAKGIAAGLGCPLFAVPSLGLIAAGSDLPPGAYLAALDALRGEYYVGLYSRDDSGDVREIEPARLVAAGILDDAASDVSAKIIGPSHGGFPPRARGAVHLEQLLAERGQVNVAAWEPAYGRLAEAQVRWESVHGRPLPRG